MYAQQVYYTNKPIKSKYYNLLICSIEFGHSDRKSMSVVSMMVILGILFLHSRQLDAFVKRPFYTNRHQHALFSWQEEAVKGIVTISSLLIFIKLNDKRISEAGAASDKRFTEAGAASDKRFTDLIASHSAIRSADKDTLNAIVQKMSTEIQASNARTDAEIQASNARTDAEIKSASARTNAEIKDAFGRMEEILRKRKFF